MSSLFNITGKYLEVLNLAELGAEDQLIADTLESIEDEYEVKADNYINFIKHLEGNNEMIKKETDRLAKRKKANDNLIKNLKRGLIDSMKMKGQREIKTNLNHMYIRNNQESLHIEKGKEANIPDDFFKVKKEVDKTKLKEHIQKTGEIFDGVGLERSESVILK